MRSKILLDWLVGCSKNLDLDPLEWIEASVPGAVQLDWARVKGWPDYWKGDNFRKYEWMEDRFWIYTSRFECPRLDEEERLAFVCGGVDYEFDILLNGELLHHQKGMHTPVDLDLTGALAERNELNVVVYPIPKLHREAVNHTQANRSCKPPVSYGWDWHPRLVPMGIWKDTFLERRGASSLKTVIHKYVLADDFSSVEISFVAEFEGVLPVAGCLRWRLSSPDGEHSFEGELKPAGSSHAWGICVDAPDLWWPHDHGEANLYRLEVELIDKGGLVIDEMCRRIGFRRVRLVMYEEAWEEPMEYPKSRWDPPITLEVNGRHIFVKGTNWVNPEIFPGIIDSDTFRPLIDLAKKANFNMLRCWGGAIVNKDSFFEICDEQGLLVWQEFTQACLPYEAKEDYLEVLEQESRSILKQVRKHACLAIWSGGNELFATWSRMTDQSLALRLLNKNCYEMDPLTPFIPTSPLMGMAHGDYRFQDHDGREIYEIFGSSRCTAYTEFGIPSPSSVDTLKSFMTEEELFPPRRGTSWETHHAFGAWHGDTKSWLMPWISEYYFGKSDTLEEVVERGQWLQSEGYKAIYEESRRQKPRCSMAINWCYNEPWPSAANNSLIAWPLDVKPALRAVGESCRPQLLSARLPRFMWHSSDYFELELWVLNDRYQAMPADEVIAYLKLGDERVDLGVWSHDGVEENKNLKGPEMKIRLPESDSDAMEVCLESKKNSSLNSTYRLRFLP